MVNTVKNYDNSYDYGSVIHKQKSTKLNRFREIMGGILLLSSIFVSFKLTDQDGNWIIAALCIIVAATLLFQIKERIEHEQYKI